jgi:hypothetical protein
MNKKTKREIENQIKAYEKRRANLNRKQSARMYQKISNRIYRLKQKLQA